MIELRPIILARGKLLSLGGVEVIVLDHADELAVLRLHAGDVQIAVFQDFHWRKVVIDSYRPNVERNHYDKMISPFSLREKVRMRGYN